MAKLDGSFVFSLFDCCRELEKEAGKYGNAKNITLPKETLLSFQDGYSDQEEEEVKQEMNQHRVGMNYIQTHGCPPSGVVLTDASLTEDYFKFLKSERDEDGDIDISCLNNFQAADGKAESTVTAGDNLLLRWVPTNKLGIRITFEPKLVEFYDPKFDTLKEDDRGKKIVEFASKSKYHGEMSSENKIDGYGEFESTLGKYVG